MRLREGNYGDYCGQDSKIVDYSTHNDTKIPNGECLKDVEKRVRSFIDFLKENYDGKKIAVVAHRAPQLAFEIITKGKTWEQALDEDWRKTKSW